MPKSIPERWLEYKPFGKTISGTKILPFKVPLKEVVCNNLKPENRFTISILVEAFPRLKYIVDLTNTDRYYDEKEFKNYGVQYEKIMVRGREVPTMDVVRKFFKVMDDFTAACGEEDIIGVHCTHGINRSGYLICRYLVQQLGWELDNCLKAFGEARGYPIEREIYLNALKKTPRDKKIDTSKVSLKSPPPLSFEAEKMRSLFKMSRNQSVPNTMGPPGFLPLRRGFAKNGPYPLPRFGFGGPSQDFRSMPPIPPPPGSLPMYGPRPFRYGPPLRPVMPPPPPRPGFLAPGFPSQHGLNRTPVGVRLPPGPPARLPPPKMPPPPPPPSAAPGRPIVLKRIHTQKRKQHMRIDMVTSVRNTIRSGSRLIRRNNQMSKVLPKLPKEQDFTVDTFEENLLAASSHRAGGQRKDDLIRTSDDMPLRRHSVT
ncbi:RNA/RNP complex-1-interacting phosphatase-like [Colletes gigas]|uniref:RNA/RNP complex-1-interacting phosphatase-like n=1 Tax=Colletes gigas TaxID=935657 RepID=UPI001C9BB5EB|nr:RNA/RNP complex-1-interacting phosphatase-like [Colletes gigas]